MTAVSLVLAGVVCNFTEDIVSRPAAMLLAFATGGQLNNIRIDQYGRPTVFSNRTRQISNNPVTTSLYALAYFQKYAGQLDGGYVNYVEKIPNLPRKKYFEFGLNCANWLLAKQQINHADGFEYALWQYDSPKAVYGIRPPYVSGLAQAFGIQALLTAYDITKNRKYIDGARLAFNAFKVEVSDGGVTLKDSKDAWWFEEYAHPQAAVSRVLNGMQFAVLAIHDYFKATGDPEAQAVFLRGVTALKHHLKDYDAQWWTYYDIRGQLANKEYQRIHIQLNSKLFERSGDATFDYYAKKWQKYNTPFLLREFWHQPPNYHDIVIFGLNFMVMFVLLAGAYAAWRIALKIRRAR